MTLEDLKGSAISFEDKVSNILSSLEMNGNERGVVVSLKRGDTFRIVGVDKSTLDTTTQQGGTPFVPIIFRTDTGAMIGARNFGNIEDLDIPLGSTVSEIVTFAVKCIEQGIEFKVDKITSTEVERIDGPSYIRKTFTLSLA